MVHVDGLREKDEKDERRVVEGDGGKISLRGGERKRVYVKNRASSSWRRKIEHLTPGIIHAPQI